MTETKPLVLYDGVCNLCSGVVKFVIEHDKKSVLHFASLQSQTGHAFLKQYHLDAEIFNSFVFIQNNKAYTLSTGALRLFRALGFPWALAYVFIMVPKGIRNMVYHWVSRHRYQWFGKNDRCMIPDENIKNRFLDWEEKSGS